MKENKLSPILRGKAVSIFSGVAKLEFTYLQSNLSAKPSKL